jgi:hypothetical protein
MENKTTIRVYIDDKEMLYSHKNIMQFLLTFLSYLTNDDLDELNLRLRSLKDHRKQKEYRAQLEAKEKSIENDLTNLFHD